MYQELVYNLSKEKLPLIKQKMLNFIKEFSIFSYMDNCEFNIKPNRYELLVGGANEPMINWQKSICKDWLLGYIRYEWNNYTYVSQKNEAPLIQFFKPEIVAFIPIGKCELHIQSKNLDLTKILNKILETKIPTDNAFNINTIKPLNTINYTEYETNAKSIINEINKGNAYEVNYCLAYKGVAEFDPIQLYNKVKSENPSPFSALYKNGTHHIICASPERFLFKNQQSITSQPIKGTRRRGNSIEEDIFLKKELANDPKEAAENTMVTDLVRNDLGKIAEPGCVTVTRFKEVQSFAQVFQLVSTIHAEVSKKLPIIDILKATFPMGSMTGAPKHKVLKIIQQHESQNREFYSGSLGYITPSGDFDFNVIIRSLVYNHQNYKYSFQAGGALTNKSIIEQEWEEIQIKANYFANIFK